MPNPFVWFDNLSSAAPETARFLAAMFDWDQKPMGPMTLQIDGDNGPFSGVGDQFAGMSGWIPYVEVDDLAEAERRARQAGAVVVVANKAGPAGEATFIRDPGGSVMALWKRGADT